VQRWGRDSGSQTDSDSCNKRPYLALYPVTLTMYVPSPSDEARGGRADGVVSSAGAAPTASERRLATDSERASSWRWLPPLGTFRDAMVADIFHPAARELADYGPSVGVLDKGAREGVKEARGERECRTHRPAFGRAAPGARGEPMEGGVACVCVCMCVCV
jgi:hypothetical protein